jgi:MFS superfamily sulfate permease-like transporter
VNVLCSFLNSITACASVSRSAILYDLHPHSQVSGLITAAVLLPVLLFLTSFFTHLPMCVLATIIMVALKGEHVELLTMLPLFKPYSFNANNCRNCGASAKSTCASGW